MQNHLVIIQLPVIIDQSAARAHIRKEGGNDLFHSLKEKERREILDKLHSMLMMEARVDEGLRIGAAAKEVALFFKGKPGMSAKSIQNNFGVWKKGGQKQDSTGKKSGQWYNAREWTFFIKNYNNGCPDAVLQNEPFCKFLGNLFTDTCRWDTKGNALQARLLDIWYAQQEVPGFGTQSEWCARNGRPVPDGPLRRPEEYPDGWSARNLLRVIEQELPSSSAQILARMGEHAAHSSWGDQLLRDRSKLMPFQLITFDDVRFDIRVAMPMPDGSLQVVYPQALFALDVATGVILHKAVVGTYTRKADMDGGKKGTKRGFQHADMRFIVTGMLEMFGVPRDWEMTLLVEKASASIDRTDQLAFERQFGIKVEETQRIESKLHGFTEQGGAPWQKGWIEALFRLVHTRYNHLPGVVGANYKLTRGGVEGNAGSMVDECLKLAKQAREQNIPYDKVQFPFMTIDQFHDFLDELVLKLNWRTGHSLQGFSKVAEIEYEPGKYLRIDDPRADAYLDVGVKMRPRRMETPAEKLMRQMRGHNMDHFHPREILVMSMLKKPITVTKNRISIEASHISNDPLIFRCPKTAPILEKFNGKKKALIYYLKPDASQVHLFTNDEEMDYVCSPMRYDRIDMTDESATLKRLGEVHRGRNRIRDGVADLIAPSLERNDARRDYNTALFAGTIPTDRITRQIDTAEETQKTTADREEKIRKAISLSSDDLLVGQEPQEDETNWDEGYSNKFDSDEFLNQ